MFSFIEPDLRHSECLRCHKVVRRLQLRKALFRKRLAPGVALAPFYSPQMRRTCRMQKHNSFKRTALAALLSAIGVAFVPPCQAADIANYSVIKQQNFVQTVAGSASMDAAAAS